MASFLARLRWGKVKRRKTLRPYARRRPKGYEAKRPGDLVQVDTLTVTLGPGEVIKHFSAVDLFTRFSLRATANLAAGFLAHLIARAPFPVKAIQVDGGSEFMAEFEEACQRLGIELFVLPPKSPSSMLTWGGCSGPFGRSFTPGLCRRGFLSFKRSRSRGASHVLLASMGRASSIRAMPY